MTPYARSVLQLDPALQPFVARLPQQVAGLYPLDVVAISGISTESPHTQIFSELAVVALVLRGYDLYTSLAIYSTFRREHPDFQPENTMLAPRRALVELYGEITGGLIAQTLIDPDSQPILHTLLFPPAEEREVVRQSCVAVFATDFAAAPARVTQWRLKTTSAPLPPRAAEMYYHKATGVWPDTSLMHTTTGAILRCLNIYEPNTAS